MFQEGIWGQTYAFLYYEPKIDYIEISVLFKLFKCSITLAQSTSDLLHGRSENFCMYLYPSRSVLQAIKYMCGLHHQQQKMSYVTKLSYVKNNGWWYIDKLI